jgi:hypothetical protein
VSKPRRKLPLILGATPEAGRSARALLPDRVVENIVGEALADERVLAANNQRVVLHLRDDVGAVVIPARSPLTGRRAWAVVKVDRLRRWERW